MGFQIWPQKNQRGPTPSPNQAHLLCVSRGMGRLSHSGDITETASNPWLFLISPKGALSPPTEAPALPQSFSSIIPFTYFTLACFVSF